MLYGLYLSAAGLSLNQHRQDVIANNLANVDTTGFKRSEPVFKQRLQEALTSAGGARFVAPAYRGATGGAFVSRVHTDFSGGTLETTSRPLDIALDGPGMLMVQDGEQRAYSRDGRLTLAGGKLVRMTDGKAVLDEDGRPIELGQASVSDLQISSDGSVLVKGQRMGRLGIVEFTDQQKSQLTKLGGNLFRSADQGVSAASTTVVSEALERSGVNPARELVEMIKAARSFQLNAEMISLQDQSLGRLVNEVTRL